MSLTPKLNKVVHRWKVKGSQRHDNNNNRADIPVVVALRSTRKSRMYIVYIDTKIIMVP